MIMIINLNLYQRLDDDDEESPPQRFAGDLPVDSPDSPGADTREKLFRKEKERLEIVHDDPAPIKKRFRRMMEENVKATKARKEKIAKKNKTTEQRSEESKQRMEEKREQDLQKREEKKKDKLAEKQLGKLNAQARTKINHALNEVLKEKGKIDSLATSITDRLDEIKSTQKKLGDDSRSFQAKAREEKKKLKRQTNLNEGDLRRAMNKISGAILKIRNDATRQIRVLHSEELSIKNKLRKLQSKQAKLDKIYKVINNARHSREPLAALDKLVQELTKAGISKTGIEIPRSRRQGL